MQSPVTSTTQFTAPAVASVRVTGNMLNYILCTGLSLITGWNRKIRQFFGLILCLYLVISELLDLANSYCEFHLKNRCEQIITQGITVENAAMLYATAISYQAKVSFCLNCVY